MKNLKAAAVFTFTTLLVSACSRVNEPEIAAQVGESHKRTVSKLAELPPDLRDYLLDHFDWRQDRRTMPVDSRTLHERAIITDERGWFTPSCVGLPGYSHTLFVRAIEVGRYWVIQYQFGGIVHGAALLVVSRDDTGNYSKRDQAYLHRLEARPDEIIAALKRAQQAPSEPAKIKPVS